MRLEKILIVTVVLSALLRYLWGSLGWAGEFFLIIWVFIPILALLAYYLLKIEAGFYKLIIVYFILSVIGILFSILEWSGAGILLFLGTLGYIIFPLYLLNKNRKNLETNIFKYCLLLTIVLLAQNILYLFMPTSNLLTIGHMLSYVVIIIAASLVFGKQTENELSNDEKKIITFIIITNVLSLLGVTFKESFYTAIWI